jgi:hypothetical protein
MRFDVLLENENFYRITIEVDVLNEDELVEKMHECFPDYKLMRWRCV